MISEADWKHFKQVKADALEWPLDHMVSLSCANSPSAYASYDVLVHQLADLLAASSRLSLTI